MFSGSAATRYGSLLNMREVRPLLPSFVVTLNVGLNEMVHIESGCHSMRMLAFQLFERE